MADEPKIDVWLVDVDDMIHNTPMLRDMPQQAANRWAANLRNVSEADTMEALRRQIGLGQLLRMP